MQNIKNRKVNQKSPADKAITKQRTKESQRIISGTRHTDQTMNLNKNENLKL